MGVVGLYTYLKNECVQACVKVDIRKLVEEYKRENHNSEPVLVTSIQCLSYYLYDSLGWLLGVQIKQLKEQVEKFVRAWQSVGVRLVLFDAHSTTDRKRHVWIQRRLKAIKDHEQIFDILEESNANNSEPNFKDKETNLGLTEYTKYMFMELNCEIRAALEEVDEEIAEYARENHCFASMADDTDFIIYNAAKHFFLLQTLNLEEMTVIRIDTEELAKHLDIPISHLPLLASLCGNDVIPKHQLTPFHRRLNINNRSSSKFDDIARFIRQYRSSEEINARLEEIAKVAFGPRNGHRARDLNESIKSYLPRDTRISRDSFAAAPFPANDWGEILSQALASSGKFASRMIFTIVWGRHPFDMTSTLEDFRLNDLPMSATLLKPLRRRIYGILLSEKPGGPGFVAEWWISGENNINAPEKVTPVMSQQVEHPGLLALWSDDATLSSTRWELFVRSVTPQLSATALRDLPMRLVVPAAILAYLRFQIPKEGEPYLHDWELDAMAIQAVLLPTTDPSLIVVEPPYASRAIRLATVFMRAVSHMLLLLAATGFPIPLKEAMPWTYFDGKLFHSTYKSLMEPEPRTVAQLCINQAGESLHDEFTLLHAFI